MALVSCVVPTRGRPDRLRGAVESALAQTHEDIEVVVVHEPTDEETARVVAELAATDDRVVGVSAAAGSPMAARNVGIEAADGEYVAFLDDDDRWHPEKVAAQLPHADDHSVVSCVPRILRPEGEMVQPHAFSGVAEMDLEDVFEAMQYFPGSGTVGVSYLYPSGTLARTDRVRAIGGFEADRHEWDFYIRAVAEFGPAAVLDRPLVEFNREDIERYCERAETVERLRDTLAAHGDRVSAGVRRRRRGHLALAACQQADGPAARARALARVFYYDPGRGVRAARRFLSGLADG